MYVSGRDGPRRLRFRRRTPAGAPPGTLLPDPESGQTRIRLIAYNAEAVLDVEVRDIAEIREALRTHSVVWIDIAGIGDVDAIVRIGEEFGLHPLALEDAVHVHQRGKVEEYANYLFIVARMARLSEHVETEQLSIFLGDRYVITVQETPEDCLDPVRERIQKSNGRIRDRGADYLAYSLLDAVVDHYFPILEEVGERLDRLESDLITDPGPGVISRVHAQRRDLLTLRRAVWPQREALSQLLRNESPLISDDTRLYLRDCYDHTVQILDLLENFREIAAGMIDVYLSSASHRMNEIMKLLTIIATIFIPLTFIAGVYGMNFDPDTSPLNMPELRWYWGYPAALLVMLATALGLLAYFRRRHWI